MMPAPADDDALREAADGFFLAAEHGRSDVIKALADHSDGCLDLARIVDPTTGRTPLHVAVLHRKTDALRVLLTAGFPPHIESFSVTNSSPTTRSSPRNGKRTAYALAVEAKAHDLVFVFHQFAIQQVAMNSVEGVSQLLKGGVPVDMTDGAATGNTLLHWAVTCKAMDVALFLLQHKDDKSDDGHSSEATAHAGLVDLANAEGATPLHLACRDGQLEFVQLLLRHGADPRCTGTGGFCKAKTPMDLVISTEIRALLTSHEETRLLQVTSAISAESPERGMPEERSAGVDTTGDEFEESTLLAVERRKHALQMEEKDLLIRQLKSTIESLVIESQEIRKLGEERTVLDYIRKLREEKDVVRRQLEDAEDHIRIQQQQIQELKREIRHLQPAAAATATPIVSRVAEEATVETQSRNGRPPRIDTRPPSPNPQPDSRQTPPRQTPPTAAAMPTRSESGAWSDVWSVLWGNGLEADAVDADGEVIMTV